MGTSKVQIIIEADDKASAKLKGVANALSEVEKESKKQPSTLDKLQKNWMAITGALVAVTGAVVALKKVWQFSQEGAQMLRLEQAGRSLSASFGQDMDGIVRAMQEASGSTISRMQAIELANRAMLLGVAETPEAFRKLTTASVALGRAMGRTAFEAVTDIVTGVGRMSPLILDNLGILTKGGKIFDEYARTVGKTADQLTDTERKQVLLNAALDSAAPLLNNAGEAAEDAAAGYEKLGAASADAGDRIKKALGEVFAPAAAALADQLEGELATSDAATEASARRALAYRILVRDGIQPNVAAVSRLAAVIQTADLTTRSLDEGMYRTGKTAKSFSEGASEMWQVFLADAEAAKNAMPSIWDKVFPSPAELGRRLQEQIDFIQAGGPGLVAAFENVQSALRLGEITPEQAEEMLDPLMAAADGLSVKLGDTTIWDAAEQRAKELGIPFEEAKQDILDGIAAIETIPQEIDIKINWIMEEIPKLQHGGSFRVGGSGGPDSQLVMFRGTPGEQVSVTPPGATYNQQRTLNQTYNGAQMSQDVFNRMGMEFLRG